MKEECGLKKYIKCSNLSAQNYESLNKLFSDTAKIKRLDVDPTNTKLSTLQSYLRKLYNRNKISKEVYQEILKSS